MKIKRRLEINPNPVPTATQDSSNKNVTPKKKQVKVVKPEPDKKGEYEDLNSKQEIVIDDNHKVVIRVKRSEESAVDVGLLYLDIQHYVKSDSYTGYTKQKVHIPLYRLPELKMLLQDTIDECDEKGLLTESKAEWTE